MIQQITGRIGFVGGGNMARALIGGLIRDRMAATDIRVFEPDPARAAGLKADFGIELAPDNSSLGARCATLILAVKPQHMKLAVQEASRALGNPVPLVISIAAGVDTLRLRAWAGVDLPIVRVMPNTPALIGKGISALYANDLVVGSQRGLAERVLGSVGQTLWVDTEDDIDKVTAVSGSGPAYFFLAIEALAQAGERLGLSPAVARQLSTATARGAAELAFCSVESVAELRRQVTSPDGTTERAIACFTDGGFVELFELAVTAAYRRASQLADEAGKQ